MPKQEEERVVSIQEAARRLAVSEQTIRRLVKSGEIQSFRVGWQVRIPESEIERIRHSDSDKS